MQTQKIPHVVVVGGGFGGLWAARALAGSPVRVSLIDRVNHHLFQPLLYQVATAGLSMPDIAAPLRHILRRQRNATVPLGDVVAIDCDARRLRCADGSGWWVASDQFADRTVFHLFDRRSLAHAGSFAGEVTGLTDGVWLDARGDARFPQGVFYASHLDLGVAAFDWRDIAAALELPECVR